MHITDHLFCTHGSDPGQRIHLGGSTDTTSRFASVHASLTYSNPFFSSMERWFNCIFFCDFTAWVAGPTAKDNSEGIESYEEINIINPLTSNCPWRLPCTASQGTDKTPSNQRKSGPRISKFVNSLGDFTKTSQFLPIS